jgi:pimeloyl-ACP methyl ester carboxylesterase
MNSSPPPPELPGVEHRYITAPDGVRIHVADAGPAAGRAIVLVHGFLSTGGSGIG